MNRPETLGFQKPLRPQMKGGRAKRGAKPKDLGMAVITYPRAGMAVCSCGTWAYKHPREKVLEDAIDKHTERKHGGLGIRM